MVLDPEVLKRKRSRPSEWWAAGVTETTPPQQGDSQPKKRGRHSHSSLVDRTPQDILKAYNHRITPNSKVVPFAEEDKHIAKPLRRGRSSNTEAEFKAAVDALVGIETALKKKRRPPDAEQRGEQHVVGAPENTIAPKKRGRSSISQAEEQVPVRSLSFNRSTKLSKPMRRGWSLNTKDELRSDGRTSTKQHAEQLKLGRRSKTETEVQAAVELPEEHRDVESANLLRRGRSSNTEAEVQGVVESSARGKTTYKGSDVVFGRTTGGRRSNTVIEVQAAASSLAKERNGSKRRYNASVIANVKTKSASSTAREPVKSMKYQRPSSRVPLESDTALIHGKKFRYPSDAEVNSKRKEVERLNGKLHGINRPPDDARIRHAHNDTSWTDKTPTYQHLTAVSRRVPRQTIDTKWRPLSSDCIERISQLLHDLHRPVVVLLNDDQKRTQSTTALEMVSRRLIGKISKGLPFPQGTRNHQEDDFDFEKILDHNRALEAQLTPTLHANRLLEAELIKDVAFLDSDKAALADLEANAKSDAARRKQAMRKLHSLLQLNDSPLEENLKDLAGFGGDQSLVPFFLGEDENLQEIMKGLSDHADSIHGNINQVQGITQAMAKSKATVQATLLNHLGNNQYEDVVLG